MSWRIYSKPDVGEFITLGVGHMLPTQNIEPGALHKGGKFQIVSMFEIWEVLQGTNLVGFYFQSAFKTQNKGGYIITHMESKRGMAKSCNLVLRNDSAGLIVYDYEGCGALALSTKVSKFVNDILDMQ